MPILLGLSQLTLNALDQALAAIAPHSPDAARAVAAARSRADAQIVQTPEGVPALVMGEGSSARALCSRKRPLAEAVAFADAIDLASRGVYVIAGFGMGYHVRELLRRIASAGAAGGVVVVYEPDVELLRTALDHQPDADWLASKHLRIITDPDDAAALSQALHLCEGFVAINPSGKVDLTHRLEPIRHLPSRPHIDPTLERFTRTLDGVVEALLMTVITTLNVARTTIRNLAQNVDVYASAPGIGALENALKGRPAIVVSAGPSLRRNIDLLRSPGVRERVCIVAVQTVLKTLLAKGIRPHFVTALDYSEINRRFYEGLSPADVEGITLVVEPKVNPSVTTAWTRLGGRIMCVGDRTLDLLLGSDLAKPNVALKPGATVAHLAHTLARHMGCDPVALIGQDLGFTDGQYYAANASIHGVWACELNEFKSLELLEFQRIARMGTHLRSALDHFGRPMRTDVQMLSYLRQFEQDFREHALRGERTFDCTEGGVRKQHAEPMPLRDFLDRFAVAASIQSIDDLLAATPLAIGVAGPADTNALHAKVRERVALVRRQAGRVGDLSRKTAALLVEIAEHHADQPRVNRLITQIEKHKSEIDTLRPGFALVNLLGQSAIFHRVRADRQISFQDDRDELAVQMRRVERDLENVRTLASAGDQLAAILDDALLMLDGGERITRDLRKSIEPPIASAPSASTRTFAAVIPVDLDHSALGWPRTLDAPIAGEASILALTIRRVLAAKRVSHVALITDRPERVRALLSQDLLNDARARILPRASTATTRRPKAVATGRLWSRACWRGGISDLTCYDEVFDPIATQAALEHTNCDAALLLGPDWCAIDPALCDRVIERHENDPANHRATFTQALPGLAPMLVTAHVCRELAPGFAAGALFGSIGAMLGYLPAAPAQDLIGQSICIGLEGPERDAGLRLIADTPEMFAALGGMFASDPHLSARAIAEHVSTLALPPNELHVVVPDASSPIDETLAALASLLARHPQLAVTIRGSSPAVDPLDHPGFTRLLAAARTAPGVHVRTPLRAASPSALSILLASADVISVDIDPVLGSEPFDRLATLRASIVAENVLGVPWLVPRLIRDDGSMPIVEPFINAAVSRHAWAALDPLASASGGRIEALPIPDSARRRFARERRVLMLGESTIREWSA